MPRQGHVSPRAPRSLRTPPASEKRLNNFIQSLLFSPRIVADLSEPHRPGVGGIWESCVSHGSSIGCLGAKLRLSRTVACISSHRFPPDSGPIIVVCPGRNHVQTSFWPLDSESLQYHDRRRRENLLPFVLCCRRVGKWMIFLFSSHPLLHSGFLNLLPFAG